MRRPHEAAEIANYEGLLTSAKERVNRAYAAAEGLTPPDLEGLRLALRDAKGKVEIAAREEGLLTRQVEQVENWLGDLERIQQELQIREDRYKVVGYLCDIASGKNKYKISFQRYVLAKLLDAVLSDASRRLQVMSKGRYILQRAESPSDRRRASGLELVVVDTWTGDSLRSVSTLSGGESFYTSLALALGLANTVQAYAGGIHLDTIFVDEGFGSLDSNTLDLAIRTLESLQEGKRLVGIISHVDSLTERVPKRLEVKTGTQGSTARFVG